MRDDEIFYRFTPFIQDYIYQSGRTDDLDLEAYANLPLESERREL